MDEQSILRVKKELTFADIPATTATDYGTNNKYHKNMGINGFGIKSEKSGGSS